MKAIAKQSLFLLLLATLVSCGNAGNPVEPQIITFNYAIMTVPDVTAFVDTVKSGLTTVSSLLANGPCNFSASFAGNAEPSVSVSGTPGQNGFNINAASVTPVSLTTTNPPNCPALAEYEIGIGGRSSAVAVGALTDIVNGKFSFADGQKFETSPFAQAKVIGHNAATARATGEFRFVNRLTSAATETVLVVEGSFALND